MNVLWAVLIVAGATTAAVTALLLVRRRAPAGSYFEDGDRAAGVFGVLATSFAVLLGFVVFLAFQSFDTARSGAEQEAQIVAQQFETAQFFPPAQRAGLSGAIVCYARSVVHREWPAMSAGTIGEKPNPFGVVTFRILQRVKPVTPVQQAAFSKWLDQRSDRESARADRIHGGEGVIPSPLWVVLLLSAVVIFVFMLFFADSAERAVVQGMMIGAVTMLITSTLLLLWFLDHPYNSGFGELRPVAMERTTRILGYEANVVGHRLQVPCSALGDPRTA